MKALGWGRLFAGEIAKPAPGEAWALDNGVFSAWKSGALWDEQAFAWTLLRAHRGVACGRDQAPLFAVIPDKVADPASLRFSLDWYEKHASGYELPWFLVLQNGMRSHDVVAAVRGSGIAGLFLGGDDDFKLTAPAWCELAHGLGVRFHFARVSTVDRLRQANAIGADSCDTTQPLWSEEAFERFERAFLSMKEAA